MNKVYIAHISFDTTVSNMIGAVSSLNYPNIPNFVHNALVYENNEGVKFITESSIDSNIHHMNFEDFQKAHDKDDLKIEFTSLGDMIPIITPGKDSFHDFEKFLDEHYKNFGYSFEKAMTSIEINGLPNFDMFEIFDKKATAQHKKIIGGYATVNYKEVMHDLFETISQQLEKAGQDEKATNMHSLSEASRNMSDITEHLIQLSYETEKNNTDPDRKFLFCTEYVLDVVKDWTTQENIDYPNILNITELQDQNMYKIYPQKLYETLQEHEIHNAVRISESYSTNSQDICRCEAPIESFDDVLTESKQICLSMF